MVRPRTAEPIAASEVKMRRLPRIIFPLSFNSLPRPTPSQPYRLSILTTRREASALQSTIFLFHFFFPTCF